MTDIQHIAARDEVEKFLATTEFTGYQAVPLPHGLALPGDDPRERLEQVFRLPMEGRSFLDVGSYYGLFPYAAIERGARRAVGLEPAAERCAIAQRVAALHGGRWEIRRSTVEDLGPDESFDVVTFLNVLHHVLDPIEAIRRLVRICTETLIVEFCLPDDPQMLVRLYDASGTGGRLRWWQARVRSATLRMVAGRLPLAAVGNWPVHRTWYFSPQAFENLFRVHLGWFESIRFEATATGLRRTMAYCRVAPGVREQLRAAG